MAVIESLTVENFSVSSTLTITAPTGITEGDLLVATCLSLRSGDFSPPAGWTDLLLTNGSVDAFYKYATLADETESNYSFTTSGLLSPAKTGGVIYRLSGVVETDPQIEILQGSGPGDEATVSITGTLDIIAENSLLIMVVSQSDSNFEDGNVENYYVTGGDNPTFTERLDEASGSSDESDVHSADAIYSSTDNITEFGWETLASIGSQYGALIAIPRQNDATGTNDFFTASPSQFSQSGSAGTTGTNDFHAAGAYLPNQSGKASAPTQWTNQNKPDTDWTNKEI